MISTHLSTFQPQKWDFAKHAQPQPKKVRAYKKKVYHLSLYLKACLITWYSNNWFKQKRCIYYVTVTCYSTTDFKTPLYHARTCLLLLLLFSKKKQKKKTFGPRNRSLFLLLSSACHCTVLVSSFLNLLYFFLRFLAWFTWYTHPQTLTYKSH